MAEYLQSQCFKTRTISANKKAIVRGDDGWRRKPNSAAAAPEETGTDAQRAQGQGGGLGNRGDGELSPTYTVTRGQAINIDSNRTIRIGYFWSDNDGAGPVAVSGQSSSGNNY